MALELSADAQRWLARLPELVNIILVALIGLALAHLFWLIWPEPAAEVIAPSETNPVARADRAEPVDVAAIAGAHLFGEQSVASDADAERQKEIDAPETQLNLELTGIIADRQGSRSRALIKNQQGKQDSYKVAQQIVSGVKLRAIYADRVILDRSGKLETLTLESVKKAKSMTGLSRSASTASAGGSDRSADNTRTARANTGSATDESSETTQQTSSDELTQKLASARADILANPANTQRYIRLRPAREDGNLIGYRVFPGQDNTLFKQAGLQSGELVTAINGQPLTNPAASLKMLGGLANAGSATITVENDGVARDVQVNFR